MKSNDDNSDESRAREIAEKAQRTVNALNEGLVKRFESFSESMNTKFGEAQYHVAEYYKQVYDLIVAVTFRDLSAIPENVKIKIPSDAKSQPKRGRQDKETKAQAILEIQAELGIERFSIKWTREGRGARVYIDRASVFLSRKLANLIAVLASDEDPSVDSDDFVAFKSMDFVIKRLMKAESKTKPMKPHAVVERVRRLCEALGKAGINSLLVDRGSMLRLRVLRDPLAMPGGDGHAGLAGVPVTSL